MTIGVSFDGIHCLNGMGIYLTNADIGTPDVQTNYVEIPGRDGLLDLTESLTGDIRYGNREIKLSFATEKRISQKDWQDLLSDVSNALHGQKKKICFDGDDYYYIGRCSVDSFSVDGEAHTFDVICNCDPYKYNTSDSTVKSL